MPLIRNFDPISAETIDGATQKERKLQNWLMEVKMRVLGATIKSGGASGFSRKHKARLTLGKGIVASACVAWAMSGSLALAQANATNPSTGLLDEVDPEVAIKSGTIWDKRIINVCWENPSSRNATERQWTRSAVEDSWQAVTELKFVGWQECPSYLASGSFTSSRYLTDIRIKIEDIGPHVDVLGKRLDGLPNGMSLNFTFSNWSVGCSAASMREFCIRNIAVHEFGHAIGIAHEHNRGDSSSWCTNEPQGTDPDVYVTPWDPRSVMNYCNENWGGNGQLSALDIEGAQLFYGVPQDWSRGVLGQLLLVNGNSRRNLWQTVRVQRRGRDQSWAFGDVNGDGQTDLISMYNATIAGQQQREADVYLSNGQSFAREPTPFLSQGAVGGAPWLVGDFDGDGRDDLLSSSEGSWSISQYATGDWARVNSSNVRTNSLVVGDFSGDGKADVFRVRGAEWQVSYGATSGWTRLGSSGIDPSQFRFGDINGDGKSDIIRISGSKWYVSYGGTERWAELGSSGYPLSSLYLADLNGDGRDDVAHVSNGRVQVSYGGTSRWSLLLEGIPLGEVVFEDFNGDGTDDLFVFARN